MKKNILRLISLACIILPAYCFGSQTDSTSYSPINKAFNLFLKGKITAPASLYLDASDHLSSISLKNPTIENEAKQLILSSYGLYIANFYEYSYIKPRNEVQNTMQNKILLLSKLDTTNLSDSLKSSIYNMKGLLYLLLTKYEHAKTSFENALQILPNLPVLNNNLGDALFYLGNYDDAESLLESAINADPTLLQAYYYLGWIYYQSNRENKALEIGAQALKIDANYFHIYNLYAGVYSKLGDNIRSREEYNKLLKINPKWTLAYTNLAYEYIFTDNSNDKIKAIQFAKKAISINPYKSMGYKRAGDAFEAMGATDSALYYYNKCNQIDSSCYTDLAWINYNQYEYKKGISFARLALKANKYSVEANRLLGWCWYFQSNYDSAIVYFQHAIRLSPFNSSSLSGLAYGYRGLKNYEEAVNAWERLIIKYPSNQSYVYRIGSDLITLAKIALEEDRKQDALNWLLKGSRLGNKFCRLYANGVMHEFGLGVEPNPQLAMDSYKKGAKRVYLFSFLQKRIITLYEEQKVSMDSAHYKYWKDEIFSSNLKKFTVPCEKVNGSEVKRDVYILSSYPPKIHPLEWEAERLKEEEKVLIPKRIMDSFDKLLKLARRNGLSYPDLCVYALEEAENKLVAGLLETITNDTVSIANKKLSYNQIIEHYELQFSKDSTEVNEKVFHKSMDDYVEFLQEIHDYNLAQLWLKRKYNLDTTDNNYLRSFARINIREFENARKKNSNADFKNYLKSDRLAALGVYYRYFLDSTNLQSAIFFQSKVLSIANTPSVKFVLFENQTEYNVDLFDELYLKNNNSIASDIRYFILEIQAKKKNEDKVFLYKHLIRLDNQLLKSIDSDSMRTSISQHYNSLAWYQLLIGKFKESELSIRKGLALDETNLYLYTNLPSSLLFQGKYDKARQIYEEWKDKAFYRNTDYAKFKDIYLSDFEVFKEQKIIPEEFKNDVDNIIAFLNK